MREVARSGVRATGGEVTMPEDPTNEDELDDFDSRTEVREEPPRSDPGVIVIPRPGRRARLAAGLLLGLVAGAALSVGGYFVGQGTRKSDEQVARERAAAVTKAVAAKGAEDHAKRLRIMARAEERQKRRQRVVIRRVVRKLKKSADRKAAQSFASGQSSGYSSGRDAGVEEGIVRGSDQLTCSDDPDVTWLPFCNY